MATVVENLPQIDRDSIQSERLEEIVSNAEENKAPPVAWYLTVGHNEEVATAFAAYWDLVHRGGTVPFEIKELCRIQIAQMIGCEFCARQR